MATTCARSDAIRVGQFRHRCVTGGSLVSSNERHKRCDRENLMRVFLAGATGALGTHLVPKLVAGGHDVVGMTRTAAKGDALRGLGARPVVADALDPDAVGRAVAQAEPEVIVHRVTALSGEIDMRHLDRFCAMTNRLRTGGTDHLLAAGRAAGVRRFVAQSYAGWPFARTGGPVKSEN